MSRPLLVAGALALGAAGFAAGVAVSGATAPDETAPEPIVVVRTKDGGPREMTLAEAAARIERLEAQAARAPRARAAVAEPDETEEPEVAARRIAAEIANVPIPTRPDGKPYSTAEIRDLARNSSDPVLRAAAIRALRRDDSPEARKLLEEIVTDAQTPADLRVEAAKSLSKPPHRDATPDELVKLLAATDLPPDVRREIAEGVTRLKDRGAWMSEISSQLAKETDAEVRGLLFESVARTASDPAAKAELIGIVTNPAASPDEARLAAQALARLGNDPRALAALRGLLGSSDPAIREQAVFAQARAGKMSKDELAASMSDAAPGVRAAVFAASVPGLPKNATKEQRQERNAMLEDAARLASADPDADVRRAALAWTGSMPAPLRDRTLAAAREDSNALVSMEAYARSPASVTKAQPERILTQLDSTDPKVRDAAYRLVVRTWGVDVPYRAGWNANARAAAIREIRSQVATR